MEQIDATVSSLIAQQLGIGPFASSHEGKGVSPSLPVPPAKPLTPFSRPSSWSDDLLEGDDSAQLSSDDDPREEEASPVMSGGIPPEDLAKDMQVEDEEHEGIADAGQESTFAELFANASPDSGFATEPIPERKRSVVLRAHVGGLASPSAVQERF